MSRCKQCNVEILDETDRCPLCNSVLEPTVEVENMYPDVRLIARKMQLISRIYLFCGILAQCVLTFINYITTSEIWWCVLTGMVIFYGYMVIRFAILGTSGYIFKSIALVLIAILMSIVVDFVMGYSGWSVNYALPSAIILVDISIVILMITNHRNWQSYLMWQIFMILCSVITFLLYLAGIIKDDREVLVALACSVFLFLGTVIIGDRRARVELKRRFHIR